VEKRLYKSEREKMVFGVCGGLGEYFDIDPTIVRAIFVVMTFLGAGLAVPAYIVLAIVMPSRPSYAKESGTNERKAEYQRGEDTYAGESGGTFNEESGKGSPDEGKSRSLDSTMIVGLVLIGMGSVFLMKKLIPNFDIPFDLIVAAAMIAVGIALLFKNRGDSDGR
jgi:phage shock protein C